MWVCRGSHLGFLDFGLKAEDLGLRLRIRAQGLGDRACNRLAPSH